MIRNTLLKVIKVKKHIKINKKILKRFVRVESLNTVLKILIIIFVSFAPISIVCTVSSPET